MTEPLGYFVSLDLKGRRVLVLGAGAESALRAQRLLEAGARVTLVAEERSPELAALPTSDALQVEQRAFLDSDLEGAWLVVQGERNPELAARVARACEARQIFFCAIDWPSQNSFSHLALARAGALTIAIGTQGKAPALARKLRGELARLLHAARAERHVQTLAELRARTPSADRASVLGAAVRGVRFTGQLLFGSEEHE
jgi:siroheme synthase-like protein